MPSKQDHVLLLTKHPTPNFAKTRLIPSLGPTSAADLSRRLTEHTILTLRDHHLQNPTTQTFIHYAQPLSTPAHAMQTWLAPRPHEHLHIQMAGSLGERLISALARSFDSGCGRCIVIGSDCPEISVSVLEQGFERLGECDVVIGPAKDGGYYLIGMKCMYRQLFEGIEWSTDRVFKQTCVCAEEMGLRVGVLGVLSDVDEPADLVDMPVLRCFDTSG